MGRELRIGMPVVYVDEYRRERPALVTNQFGAAGAIVDVDAFKARHGCGPSVNVVFAALDEDKHDPYGRQLERETSVAHVSGKPMREGRYWRFPDEE
jgi:hypothetical protein